MYPRLQQAQCMSIECKAIAYIGNSGKVCISSVLADVICDKVQRNQVIRIETIQEIKHTRGKRRRVDMDEEQENSSMRNC